MSYAKELEFIYSLSGNIVHTFIIDFNQTCVIKNTRIQH